jgi:hypothetical protein
MGSISEMTELTRFQIAVLAIIVVVGLAIVAAMLPL